MAPKIGGGPEGTETGISMKNYRLMPDNIFTHISSAVRY